MNYYGFPKFTQKSAKIKEKGNRSCIGNPRVFKNHATAHKTLFIWVLASHLKPWVVSYSNPRSFLFSPFVRGNRFGTSSKWVEEGQGRPRSSRAILCHGWTRGTAGSDRWRSAMELRFLSMADRGREQEYGSLGRQRAGGSGGKVEASEWGSGERFWLSQREMEHQHMCSNGGGALCAWLARRGRVSPLETIPRTGGGWRSIQDGTLIRATSRQNLDMGL